MSHEKLIQQINERLDWIPDDLRYDSPNDFVTMLQQSSDALEARGREIARLEKIIANADPEGLQQDTMTMDIWQQLHKKHYPENY